MMAKSRFGFKGVRGNLWQCLYSLPTAGRLSQPSPSVYVLLHPPKGGGGEAEGS